MIRQEILDGRINRYGKVETASRRFQFVEIAENGEVRGGGVAPYLDYRPLTEEERNAMSKLVNAQWLRIDLEKLATDYATNELMEVHYQEVKERRGKQVLKVMAAVKERLTKEIQYWDNRSIELEEQVKAGRQPRLQPDNARRRADELQERMQRRMRELELERQLLQQPRVVEGGAQVVPQRVLERMLGKSPGPNSTDNVNRKAIEELAMKAVEEAEIEAGRIPRRVDHLNLGYYIESQDRETGRLHFIEVKGRHAEADSLHVTKNEWLVALNKRDMFVLAIVLVRDGSVVETPHYVRDPMARAISGDLTFGITGIDLSIKELVDLEKTGGSRMNLQHTVKAVIQKGETHFVAECVEIAVVTQGKTLDETMANLQEAVALHLEDEDLEALGLAPNPTILVTMELEPAYA